jgi:hypothetical protein
LPRPPGPARLEALTVSVDPQEPNGWSRLWEGSRYRSSAQVLASPYREVTNPIIDYVRNLRREVRGTS